jgi:integrase
MFGRFRLEAQMNRPLSSCDARNANTHSENTHKHSDFQKGRILQLAFELRKLGYSEAYLKTLIRALNSIASQVNIDDSSSVLELIARGHWRDSYKSNLCDFYSHYCKAYSIAFTRPKYRRDHKIPSVPTEEKINLILGHASKKYVIIYKIAMECGLRPIEIGNLTSDDVDLDRGLLSVRSARHGNPRVLKLKNETLALLTTYIKTSKPSSRCTLFPSGSVISNTFERLRTSIARKLNDSGLKRIRLYDLRHYYATMLYHRTRDILLVKEKLGHKNINNTLVYTHLVSFNDGDEFYSATAKSVDEAQKLIEQGFDFVCDLEGVKLFRKRR